MTKATPPFNGANIKTNAHFINITDTLSLDDTSKTEVRVQVMREYHRRRKQGKISKTEAIIAQKAPLSAKSQTQKFRLDREKVLRPWVRVKPYVPKKSQTASTKSNVTRPSEPNDGWKHPSQPDLDPQYSRTTLLEENTESIQSTETITETGLLTSRNEKHTDVVYERMQALKSALETISIYQNPASGVLDPFSAMSLLITPRTQLLLHHYCKFIQHLMEFEKLTSSVTVNVRLASSWLMMPMRKGLFSLAVHDAALFHTFMSHYVAAYNLRFSTGDPAESMQHRTEAIRIVNERLLDPSKALNDGTIAAVANMAVYEVSVGLSSGDLRAYLLTINLVFKWLNEEYGSPFKRTSADG